MSTLKIQNLEKIGARLIEKKYPGAAAVHLSTDEMGEPDVIHQWPVSCIVDKESWAKDVIDYAQEYCDSIMAPMTFSLRVVDEKLAQVGKQTFKLDPQIDEKGVTAGAFSGTPMDVIRQSMNHLETSHRRNSHAMSFLFGEFQKLTKLSAEIAHQAMEDRKAFYQEVVAKEAEIASAAAEKAVAKNDESTALILEKVTQFAPMILEAVNAKKKT